MFRDKDVTSSKRPAKYAEHEEEQVRRASSVTDRMAFRRGSRIRSLPQTQVEDAASANTEVESFEQKSGMHKEEV